MPNNRLLPVEKALAFTHRLLFERHLAWQEKVTIESLRFWLFITLGTIAQPAAAFCLILMPFGNSVIGERDWQRARSAKNRGRTRG